MASAETHLVRPVNGVLQSLALEVDEGGLERCVLRLELDGIFSEHGELLCHRHRLLLLLLLLLLELFLELLLVLGRPLLLLLGSLDTQLFEHPLEFLLLLLGGMRAHQRLVSQFGVELAVVNIAHPLLGKSLRGYYRGSVLGGRLLPWRLELRVLGLHLLIGLGENVRFGRHCVGHELFSSVRCWGTAGRRVQLSVGG